jgi:hypothetical protein
MGLTYNKEFQSKDRRITPSGPRDRQIKQITQISNSDQSLLITELRSQISKLQEQLESSNIGYTAEQVDEEIVKAIKSETEKLKTQHEYEKKNLQFIIDSKEEIIQQFKNNQNNNYSLTEEKILSIISDATKNMSNNNTSIVENSRPTMETVFVDPIEKETSMNKHFVVDTSTNDKVQLDDKVNKLKGLLGKLPSKKD